MLAVVGLILMSKTWPSLRKVALIHQALDFIGRHGWIFRHEVCCEIFLHAIWKLYVRKAVRIAASRIHHELFARLDLELGGIVPKLHERRRKQCYGIGWGGCGGCFDRRN